MATRSIETTPLESLDERTAESVIAGAFEQFGTDQIAISFSGAEDVVLIDIATKIRPDVQVFSLDTGRLHPETYRFIERSASTTTSRIDMLLPDAHDVEDLVQPQGSFQLLSGRPSGMLRDPQDQAAAPPAGRARCVDHRSASRPERHAHRSAARTGRRGVFDASITASSNSIRSRAGRPPTCGPTSAPTTCRTTRCTTPVS